MVQAHAEIAVAGYLAHLVGPKANDVQTFGNRGVGLIDVIYTAQWSPITYTIAFSGGEGGQVGHRAAGNKQAAAALWIACQ